MRLSFDLDGVITESNHSFFSMLRSLRVTDHEIALQAELAFYSEQPLKYHPNQFLGEDDNGIIITARKPVARRVTEQWLFRHGVILPVFYVDSNDEFDWSEYATASVLAARAKADVIANLDIDVHFDNNHILVAKMRKILPHKCIIQVGGERAY